MIASSTRQLDEVNLTMIKDMYNSQSSYSIISNVIQGRTGITFSNAKILYHCGLLDHIKNSGSSDSNNCDSILEWFTKKEYDHILLYHDSVSNSIRTDHIQVSKDLHDMFSINYPELENEDAQQDARYGRASLNIIDESRYLMAFAWVVPE